MSDCSAHRVPRAGLDPIDGPATALAVIRLAIHVPHVHETVVLLLDHARCGVGITVVGGTCRPDDVLEVTECLVTAAAGTDQVGAIVVASVRPEVDSCDSYAEHLDDRAPGAWEPSTWEPCVDGPCVCEPCDCEPYEPGAWQPCTCDPYDWEPRAWDPDRWVEMSELAEAAGIELVEWFVIGSEVTTPRDQFGEPPRW